MKININKRKDININDILDKFKNTKSELLLNS